MESRVRREGAAGRAGRTPWVPTVALLAVALTVHSCARQRPLVDDVPAAIVAEEVRLRTLVESFLRCLERAGPACYRPDTPLVIWEAIRALATARLASPPWLLSELPKAIDDQQEPLLLRRRWVGVLEAHHEWVREGMCDFDALRPLAPVLATALRDTGNRISDLGLAQSPLGKMAQELGEVAARLHDARLAHFDCPGRRRQLFVVFVRADARAVWRPVYMGQKLPSFLVEPEGAANQEVSGMLPPANAVDAWLPIALEAL